ncbi:MAG: flavodoxin domain-containing protein [Anaerolineales bacterium]
MSEILVTYASMAGSTAEIAEAIPKELKTAGVEAEVRPLSKASSIDGYAGIVLGGPMILGWDRRALRFLRRNREHWSRIPVAVFVSAMALTKTEEPAIADTRAVLDERLMKAPANPASLTLREQYSQPSNYLRPILRAMQPAKPRTIAIFGGRLLFGRLPWWAIPVALLAAAGQAGDKRDWTLIRAWAAELPNSLELHRASVA